jgi:streptogramin lyase
VNGEDGKGTAAIGRRPEPDFRRRTRCDILWRISVRREGVMVVLAALCAAASCGGTGTPTDGAARDSSSHETSSDIRDTGDAPSATDAPATVDAPEPDDVSQDAALDLANQGDAADAPGIVDSGTPPSGDGGKPSDGAAGDVASADGATSCPSAIVPGTGDGGANLMVEFPIPTAHAGAQFITAGPDGNLWFNEVQGNKLGRVTPSGCIAELRIDPSAPSGSPTYAADVTAGPDGNLWLTQSGLDKIGRIDPTGASLQEFSMSQGAIGPRHIIAGPDGNLWYSQFSPSAVARITTSGVVTSFATPTGFAQPMAMLVGPDGKIWFGESNAPKLGRIDPQTGTIDEFPLAGTPGWLSNASDGNIWMSETKLPSRKVMTKVTTAGVVTEVPLAYSGVYGPMTKGPDGNLWFTEPPVGRIARLVPATEELTEFATSSPDSNPLGVTVGPDGNIWFVESDAGKIARISP